MNNRLPLIAGVTAVVLAGGYFGLSAYSSKQAEKQLQDWAYETKMDEHLSWRSVSASPFGGRITVTDVELNLGKNEPRLQVAELVISERLVEEKRTRLRLQFNGLQADDNALGNLRQLGAMAGSGLDRSLGRASYGFAPTLNSGLAELKPFDLEVFVDLDDAAGTVQSELSVRLPELFSTHFHYQLANVRNFNRDLQRFSEHLGDDKAMRAIDRELPELLRDLETAELKSVKVGVKDLGMAQRSIALYQRYNTPLDPSAGSADKQRSEHYERVVEQAEKNCSRNLGDLPTSLESSCELLGKFLKGKISGVELSVEPTERVRLSDLGRLDGARSKRMLERLNPQFDSL